MAYAKRVDVNQSQIVKLFREGGCSVFVTSTVAGGFPDLVVGKNGQTHLVEIKSKITAKFTPAQDLFILNWKGSKVKRINGPEDAAALLSELDESIR